MVKLIFALLLFVTAFGAEAQLDLSQSGEKISIDVVDERLGSVLQQVTARLNLDTPDLSRVLAGELVNLNMRGDAEAVLSRLLRNYNHIFKYDRDGRLRGVTILGRKSSDVGPYEEIEVPEPEPLEEEEEE